jgi:hypothetical protein
MNHAFVDQVKSTSAVVELYKKNIKQPNKTIIAEKITKLIFDLEKFSTNILILLFLYLVHSCHLID